MKSWHVQRHERPFVVLYGIAHVRNREELTVATASDISPQVFQCDSELVAQVTFNSQSKIVDIP